MVPSAFTLMTGKDHWEPLLRARAIESQCYVLAPAQHGEHDDAGLKASYGHALIVDPWGLAIARASDGPGIALAEIDLERVRGAGGRSRSSRTGGCRRAARALLRPIMSDDPTDPRWKRAVLSWPRPPSAASMPSSAGSPPASTATTRSTSWPTGASGRPEAGAHRAGSSRTSRSARPRSTTPIWKNLGNTWKRFESDEIPFARLRATFGGWSGETVADDEGYFRFEIEPAAPLDASGLWHPVDLELLDPPHPVRGTGAVLVPPPDAEYGIISDIDDTVVETGVTRRLAMARTVFLGNARTRLPFEGVAAFYDALHQGVKAGGTNPIFFVSSSPWNLYDLLVEFMELHAIPPGPLLLRDLGIDRRKLFERPSIQHKLGCIRPILDSYPELKFVLIGDSGERTPRSTARWSASTRGGSWPSTSGASAARGATTRSWRWPRRCGTRGCRCSSCPTPKPPRSTPPSWA